MGSRVKTFLRNCSIFSSYPTELNLSQSGNEWIHLLVILDIPVKMILTNYETWKKCQIAWGFITVCINLHEKFHTSKSTSSRKKSGMFLVSWNFFCILHLLEADILFEDIVIFITGARVVPPLGIPKKITVSFIHECPTGCRCKLTVSTCALKLSLLPIIKQKRVWRKLFWTPLNYQMVSIRFELIYLNIVYPQYRY